MFCCFCAFLELIDVFFNSLRFFCWRRAVVSFIFGRSIKFFRLHWVVQVRYGDRCGFFVNVQVVFMSVQ